MDNDTNEYTASGLKSGTITTLKITAKSKEEVRKYIIDNNLLEQWPCINIERVHNA